VIGAARVWPCVTRWFGRWRKRSSHIGQGDALKVRAKRLAGGRDGAVRNRVDEVSASSRDREEAGKRGGKCGAAVGGNGRWVASENGNRPTAPVPVHARYWLAPAAAAAFFCASWMFCG
jgi:hypothetical protein